MGVNFGLGLEISGSRQHGSGIQISVTSDKDLNYKWWVLAMLFRCVTVCVRWKEFGKGAQSHASSFDISQA